MKRFDPPYIVALAANLQAGIAAVEGSGLAKAVAELDRMCELQSFQLSVVALRQTVDRLKAGLAFDRNGGGR